MLRAATRKPLCCRWCDDNYTSQDGKRAKRKQRRVEKRLWMIDQMD